MWGEVLTMRDIVKVAANVGKRGGSSQIDELNDAPYC
jgi:hypothetical protein